MANGILLKELYLVGSGGQISNRIFSSNHLGKWFKSSCQISNHWRTSNLKSLL